MKKTKIEYKNGKPYISVDGSLLPALAYTAYFEECGEFSDFIAAGYRMFFVNISFTDLPINNMTGFSPFLTGVFEGDKPDYYEFDGIVNKLLSLCPDALIFPRINIAMPRKWLRENPDETVKTLKGGNRESFCSDKFLTDAAELLRETVSHIKNAPYSENIAGYQLCGGTTQEWMHHDLFGSFSDMGLEKFSKWMKEKYGNVPEYRLRREDFENGTLNETVKKYGEFSCEMPPAAIEHFSKALKEAVDYGQIVGVFYGYGAFVNDYLWGLQGLRHIISSENVDFFSSPCGYDKLRALGVDWSDMLPVDTVKLHKKLCFIECDIRTHLTRSLGESRPHKYSEEILRTYGLYNANGDKTVWTGPESEELSLSAIRKAFAHQLTKASGIWWFDMWGGWFHSEKIMAEMKRLREIYEDSENKDINAYPSAETVFFVDEKAYPNVPRGNFLKDSLNITKEAMGNTGIPFDLYSVEDAERVIDKYSAAIFPFPRMSEAGKEALRICREKNIPVLCSTEEKNVFTVKELRDFLVSKGIHCYNTNNSVIYLGSGYLGIHSSIEGIHKISLPEKFYVKTLFGFDSREEFTEKIVLNMKKYETALFELKKISEKS